MHDPLLAEIAARIAGGQQIIISAPRLGVRRRLVAQIDMVTAVLFVQFCRTHWRENLHELEPPRRPPSWYPGQPDPPRVRVDRCSCLYIRHYLLGTPPPGVEIVVNPVIATAFLIDEQCTHHGIPALEHDEYDDAYPDGGVWGFTIEDC